MTYAAYTQMAQKNIMCECGGVGGGANDKANETKQVNNETKKVGELKNVPLSILATSLSLKLHT